ncbi:enoyl-[acyl-carrier protein] reductase II [Scopulibacillus darangshiensis]|uniref:Probable nitronate monooxygenase n=1 Tax=Scopulibacillus darangshiensis TaxID=442528 RepID=A0A4R2P3I7_9BACL|nr:nitronate monooxygenase [Scopulibacillus darangshiensis]TCP29242.1 enoyl-[acyl-carrier protein] reductase II [Scopulibacillus darangshiensis]
MTNRMTDILGIQYPIFQGGMGNISDAILAAAVSNAGALGTIGVGTMPLEEIRVKLAAMTSQTVKPWCVNIPLSVHPKTRAVINMVIEKKVPIVSLSAGNPKPYIPLFHENGIKVICVTASVRQAVKAEAAGADIIVCEGYEAAGINSNLETTTMTLVPQIADAVDVPVVAAGGIADGRGLAAALALGAEGVQMGTRFIATKEAPYHDAYKSSILTAEDDATTIVGRRYKRIRRIMKNDYADILIDMEKSGTTLDIYAEKTNERHHVIGAIEGNLKEGFINSGQIAGMIHDVPSVRELITGMVSRAKEILSQKNNML